MPEPPPLLLDLRRDRAKPLHRQLHDGLREAILEGRLQPGGRIPSTRALARELDVSRTTVLTAVRRLAAEGFLEARVGDGTRVSPSLQGELRGRREAREGRVPTGPRPRSRRSHTLVRASESLPASEADEPRPFQVGVPNLEAFPSARWARLAGRHWRRVAPGDLGYASRAGELGLRRAIADYIGRSRGLSAGPERILITSGSQQGLSLVARMLLDPGDAAWVEDPGFGGARGALIAAGARPVPVPVDELGLDVAAGRRRFESARLAYVTPSHQFPLGVTLDLERRLALLRWAEAGGGWVVEDDYDSEYRYEGRPLLSLQGLDDAGRVVYVGTFSKTLFPGLRLGFLAVPDDLVRPLTALRYYVDHHPPVPHQRALADFIREGDMARHVRRMRDVYLRRRDAVARHLDAVLGDALDFEPPPTGLHLTARFLRSVDDRAVETAAHARGLGVLALSPFYAGDGGDPGLVFGFGGTRVEDVESAIQELVGAVDQAIGRG